ADSAKLQVSFDIQQFRVRDSELPSRMINALVSDEQAIWIGTDNGLTRFQKGEWRTFNTANSKLPDNEVGALALGKDRSLWVGTRRGVAHFDGEWHVFQLEGLEASAFDNGVSAIASTEDGDIWVGYLQTIAKFHGGNWEYFKSGGGKFEALHVQAFAAAKDGALWVGTDQGLIRIDPKGNWQ